MIIESKWAACSEITMERPLKSNETRSANGKIGVMRIEEAPYRYDEPRLVVLWSDSVMSFFNRGDLNAQGGDWAKRRAFYEANVLKLKPNQCRDEAGAVWEFWWRDGKRQWRLLKVDGTGEDWDVWSTGLPGVANEFGDKWFEENKPTEEPPPVEPWRIWRKAPKRWPETGDYWIRVPEGAVVIVSALAGARPSPFATHIAGPIPKAVDQ